MHGLLSTPLIKITATKRKPAINSKAQEVTKDLFSSAIEKKCSNVIVTNTLPNNNKNKTR